MTLANTQNPTFIFLPAEVQRVTEKPPAPAEVPEWEAVRAQLAAVLSAGVEEFPPPFDAASDRPIDQQK